VITDDGLPYNVNQSLFKALATKDRHLAAAVKFMAHDFLHFDGTWCDIELLLNRQVADDATGFREGSQLGASTYSIVHSVVPQNRLWQTLMAWREHLVGVDIGDLLVRVKYSAKHPTREIPFADFWRLHFLQGLTDELKRGTLRCKFQPIVSRVHQSIFGYELLANFHDEKLDLGAYDLFRQVHDARERLALEGLLWTSALKQLRHLPNNKLGFVNLNPEIFFQGITDWRRTDRELAKASIAPSRMVVEILESETPYDFGELKNFVSECRRRSFTIAVDDWGQHSGNLTVLEAVRPDFVKLDVQTVRGASTDPYRRTLVEGVIDFCRSLDTKVVLEGIETADDWEWAKDSRAEFLQGYHFGRPNRSPVDCWLPTATINTAAAHFGVPSTI
jgi:EAL domain-containing protein (putative c-di-GMP-specific phosphodiesterase class I)